MSGNNAMLQNMNNPMLVQGAIVSKASLDHDTIRMFQENSENPSISAQCYPGGAQQENADCFPGDIVLGLKNCRNADIAEAEGTELGIVGVGGLHWGSCCSQQELEDQFYFLGAALTEQRISSPLDLGNYDPDHGFASLVAGTHSVINNSDRPFYPGNLVQWRLPPAPFHPKSTGAMFQGGDVINHANRYGTSATQFKVELVPFSYSDFSVPFAGAFAAMQERKAMNGISDVPYEWTLCNYEQSGRRQFSNIQDTALSFKYGLTGVALTIIEALIRNGKLQLGTNQPAQDGGAGARADVAALAAALGIFVPSDSMNTLLTECMADVFMQNISNGDPARDAAEGRMPRTASVVASSIPNDSVEEKYERLRLHALDQLVQGIALAWHSKTEKIIGRAFNCAATSDTLDVCFGHFAL